MKKLFKNKQKLSITPTPLSLPPETPIHAQRSRTAPPQSYEAAPNPDEKWIFLDEERQVTSSKPQKIPRSPSASSIRPVASNPQPHNLLMPIAAPTPVPPTPSSQIQPPPQPQPQPKKKPPPVFPWPDHRIPQQQHIETNIENLKAPSIHSADTREQREKESAFDALGTFLFGAREGRPPSERDHDKDRIREIHKTVDPQRDITQVIGMFIPCP